MCCWNQRWCNFLRSRLRCHSWTWKWYIGKRVRTSQVPCWWCSEACTSPIRRCAKWLERQRWLRLLQWLQSIHGQVYHSIWSSKCWPDSVLAWRGSLISFSQHPSASAGLGWPSNVSALPEPSLVCSRATIYGAMERIDGSTWNIDSTANGRTTTLRPRVGSHNYILGRCHLKCAVPTSARMCCCKGNLAVAPCIDGH